jgi:hypothetical protein
MIKIMDTASGPRRVHQSDHIRDREHCQRGRELVDGNSSSHALNGVRSAPAQAITQVYNLPNISSTANSGGTPQRTGSPLVPIPLVT